MSAELFEAIRKNDISAVKRLIGMVDPNQCLTEAEIQTTASTFSLYKEGNSPLLLALSLERMDIANILLSAPNINLEQTNMYGLNCLHMLAYLSGGAGYDYVDGGALHNRQVQRRDLTAEEGSIKINKAITFFNTVRKKLGENKLKALLNGKITENNRTPLMISVESVLTGNSKESFDLFELFFNSSSPESVDNILLHRSLYPENDFERIFDFLSENLSPERLSKLLIIKNPNENKTLMETAALERTIPSDRLALLLNFYCENNKPDLLNNDLNTRKNLYVRIIENYSYNPTEDSLKNGLAKLQLLRDNHVPMTQAAIDLVLSKKINPVFIDFIKTLSPPPIVSLPAKVNAEQQKQSDAALERTLTKEYEDAVTAARKKATPAQTPHELALNKAIEEGNISEMNRLLAEQDRDNSEKRSRPKK